MSEKTLNKTNLERLGAPKFADLVMERVQGSVAFCTPKLTHGPSRKFAIADLRRADRELVRCGPKLSFQYKYK